MKTKHPIPFSFVLENIFPKEPRIKLMFGCFAVYIDKKIVFILRKRNDYTDDNGVWFGTSIEHHRDLQKNISLDAFCWSFRKRNNELAAHSRGS